MKKPLVMVLSVVMLVQLCVSACATNAPAIQLEAVKRYTVEVSGILFDVTEEYNQQGNRVVTVVGDDNSAVCTAYPGYIEIIAEVESETKVFSVPSISQEASYTEPSTGNDLPILPSRVAATYSCEDWGYSCCYNTNRIATLGTLWELTIPDDTPHIAYDDNNAVYTGYANSFLDQLFEINEDIDEAKSIMTAANENMIITTVSLALAGQVGLTLAAVIGILIIHNASSASAEAWQKATDHAYRAELHFEQYRNATQGNERSPKS